jgi:hypothetical protein
MVTDNQASMIEKMMKPVTARELEGFGGTVDAGDIWTFRDGSRGKFSGRHIALYDDDHAEPIGFTYFDKLEWVQ